MNAPRRVRLITALFAMALLLAAGATIVAWRMFLDHHHRSTIERIASRLTGQPVVIRGAIHLALFPDPQIVANDVLIGSHTESVAARSLRLDLAPASLLVGRLRARRLSLTAPQIDLPWPLPGGIEAVAPPPWLASLRASIVNGTVRIGLLRLTHVDLSVLTGGPNGALAAGGTARLAGVPIRLTLNLERPNSSFATASISSHVPSKTVFSSAMHTSFTLTESRGTKVDFTGYFNNRSVLTGWVTGTADAAGLKELGLQKFLPERAVIFTADVKADEEAVTIDHAVLTGGDLRVVGSFARKTALGAVPYLDIAASGLNVQDIRTIALPAVLPAMAVRLRLEHATIDQVAVPSLSANVAFASNKAQISSLSANVAGGTIVMHGTASWHRGMQGDFDFNAPDLASVIANLRKEVPRLPAPLTNLPWANTPLDLSGRIEVTTNCLAATELHGVIGSGPTNTSWTGAVSAGFRPAKHLSVNVNFSRLTLSQDDIATGLAAIRAATTGASAPFPLNFRVHATRFRLLGKWSPHHNVFNFRHVIMDVGVRQQVIFRLVALEIDGAKVFGHGAVDANGDIDDATLVIGGRNAASTLVGLALLEPRAVRDSDPVKATGVSINDGVLSHRFSIRIAAAGPLNRLDVRFSLRLGAIVASAKQVVNVDVPSSAGHFQIRTPNAIALLEECGVPGNLDWPGAGSASLRARDLIADGKLYFPDIVANFGASTGAGYLTFTVPSVPKLSGKLDFGHLALPSLKRLMDLTHAVLLQNVDVAVPVITARVASIAGQPAARKIRASINLKRIGAAHRMAITLDAASLFGGDLRGQAVMLAGASTEPDTMALDVRLAGARANNLAAVAHRSGIAIPLRSGRVTLEAVLFGHKFNLFHWWKNVTAAMKITGVDLTVGNLDFARVASVLRAATRYPNPVSSIVAGMELRRALSSGQTVFRSGSFDISLVDGKAAIQKGELLGENGMLKFTGTMTQDKIALESTARPTDTIKPALPSIPLHIVGAASDPHWIPDLRAVMHWIREQTHK